MSINIIQLLTFKCFFKFASDEYAHDSPAFEGKHNLHLDRKFLTSFSFSKEKYSLKLDHGIFITSSVSMSSASSESLNTLSLMHSTEHNANGQNKNKHKHPIRRFRRRDSLERNSLPPEVQSAAARRHFQTTLKVTSKRVTTLPSLARLSNAIRYSFLVTHEDNELPLFVT